MFHPPIMRQLWASVLIFLTLSISARADIIVRDLEFRAGIGDRPGIIFGRLTSDSAKPDRLIAVESPDARIELHTHEMRDNIMRMRRVEAFSFAAGHKPCSTIRRASSNGFRFRASGAQNTFASYVQI